MEGIFDTILNFIGPFGGMAIHIIKKYTLTISLSTIFSIYIFYYHRGFGAYIKISSIISLLILIILKIYIESNPERILYYSGYTEHPIMRVLTAYVLFGVTYLVISSDIQGVVKKIKSWIKK